MWTKEDRPWRFFIKIETSPPSNTGSLDDCSGICGTPKDFRFYYGGGKTKKEATRNMKRKFETIIRHFEKELD